MKTFTRIEPTDIYEVGSKFKRKALVKRFRTDDGLEHEFTTFSNNDEMTVSVLAVTTDAQIIVTKQFRPGPERWMFDIPGGALDSSEPEEQAAIRELKEETGYRPGELIDLGYSYIDGFINMRRRSFLAIGCVKVAEPNLDEFEHQQGLEVILMPIEDFLSKAKEGLTTDMGTILKAYDYLIELNKEVQNEKAN